MVTTVVKTIGSGRDYSTIQAWLDATVGDLVAADEIREGQLYMEGSGTNGEWRQNALSISGSTTDATRYRHLTAAPGQSFCDNTTRQLHYDNALGVALYSTGSYYGAYVFSATEPYFRISRLQFKGRGDSLTGTGTRMDSCLKEPFTNYSALVVGATTVVRNSVLLGSLVGAGAGSEFINCTIVSSTGAGNIFPSGYHGSLRGKLTNCAAFYFASYSTTDSGSSYNATDLSSFAGSNNITSLTASSEFENATYGASMDWRLKTGSSLIDAGTSSGAPSTDIYGTTRSGIDIGAFELASAVAASAARSLRLNQAVNRASSI